MNLSEVSGVPHSCWCRIGRVASFALALLVSLHIPTSAKAQDTTKPPLPIFADATGYTIVFPGIPPNAKESDQVPNANVLFDDGTGNWKPIYPCNQRPKDAPWCFSSATVVLGGQAVVVTGIPESYSGIKTAMLRAGTTNISTLSVMFSPLSWNEVILSAAAITLLLLMIVLSLGKVKRIGTPDGRSRSLLSLFIIDPDSNSYSLSKLQLYLWLSVTLFGYIYLFLSRTFVQGLLAIPDVQLPVPAQSSLSVDGALTLAVGTVVISTGVKSLIGGKGGGDYRPTWSDLITSGGTVAPERVQFLIWTIVAIVSYIGITIATSPANISTLPVIPPELLALSGISAAGYLGGQIARGPGPQIKDLIAKLPAAGGSSLTIDISGSNLATRGSAFFIADITDASQGATDIPIQPAFEAGSVIDSGTGIATHLTLSVPQTPLIVWSRNLKYRFTVINPDGERASWEFNAT